MAGWGVWPDCCWFGLILTATNRAGLRWMGVDSGRPCRQFALRMHDACFQVIRGLLLVKLFQNHSKHLRPGVCITPTLLHKYFLIGGVNFKVSFSNAKISCFGVWNLNVKCIYFLGCHSLGRVHTEVIGRIHGWNVSWNAMLSAPFACHIVLKIALSRTDGPEVCGSISDWIKA